MDIDKILNNIKEFFDTASENDIREINDAFSVEIEGDIDFDDYLDSFNDCYFYTDEPECSYHSAAISLKASDSSFQNIDFVNQHSNYSINLEIGSADFDEALVKSTKKAA